MKDPDGHFVRRHALQLLASMQTEDPTTWQLIRSAAMKDPTVTVRSHACGLLLSASNCDEIHQRMMRINLDDRWGRYDPKVPVTSQRIAYVARKLNLSIDEVRRQYEVIADRLQIEFDLEWRKSH